MGSSVGWGIDEAQREYEEKWDRESQEVLQQTNISKIRRQMQDFMQVVNGTQQSRLFWHELDRLKQTFKL